MTADHISWAFLPEEMNGSPLFFISHIIGRLTMPIMCFFAAEGYYRTRSVKRYLLRMIVFTVISHFAYCFENGRSFIPDGILLQTSVMLPLTMGLLALTAAKSSLPQWTKIIAVLGCCAVSLTGDWAVFPVIAVLGFGLFRDNFRNQCIVLAADAVLTCAADWYLLNGNTASLITAGAVLALPLIKLYNGRRSGSKFGKWFFYIYYPAHLIIIGIIKIII